MGDNNLPIDVVSRGSKSVKQIPMNQPIMAITTALIATIIRQAFAELLT